MEAATTAATSVGTREHTSMSFILRFYHWIAGGKSSEDSPRFAVTNNFLDLVIKSGLRTAIEVDDACHAFSQQTSADFTNGEAELIALCDYLIGRTLLTRWQCERLREGRHRGFFLDNFRLDKSVGPDDTCARYAAVDLATNRNVVLRVWPRFTRVREDGSPYYEVEERSLQG
jgi:hypothetical protein